MIVLCERHLWQVTLINAYLAAAFLGTGFINFLAASVFVAAGLEVLDLSYLGAYEFVGLFKLAPVCS